MRTSLLALLLVTSASCGPRELRVTMNSDNNSGQTGFAVITDRGGNRYTVTVETSSPDFTGTQFAHIHEGNCGELGKIRVHLDDLAELDGKPGRFGSTTEVPRTTDPLDADPPKFDSFKVGEWVINAHDARDFGVYVSCGEIPRP